MNSNTVLVSASQQGVCLIIKLLMKVFIFHYSFKDIIFFSLYVKSLEWVMQFIYSCISFYGVHIIIYSLQIL